MNNRTWKIALPAALATLGILGLFIYAAPGNNQTNNTVTVNTVSPNVVSPDTTPIPPAGSYVAPATIDAVASEIIGAGIEEENIYGNGQSEITYSTSDRAALSNFNRAYDENDVQ